MSIFQRKDGRWVVKFKNLSGEWAQRSFRDENTARAFDAEQNNTPEVGSG